MRIFKMAWRNVWRNYRRSVITIAAMTIALVVELLYSGLITGLLIGMEEDAIALDSGDMQVSTPVYLTKPSLYEVVEDHESIIEQVEAKGYRASARLFSGGLAASGESSAGVGFIGVDPVRDTTVLELNQYIGEGEWLDDSDPLGVVIGRGLARTLDLELGSEVVVLSQAADGSVANELFTVRGILMTVAATMDRATILMTEKTFRELMVLPAGAHKIMIRRPVRSDLVVAGDEVRAMLDLPPAAEQNAAELEAKVWALTHPDEPPIELAEYPVAVKTWKELNVFLAQYLESVESIIVILYLIIYLAVAILILNAMLMAVFERIREFGVLKAIGYGPGRVLSLMVIEGLLQAVVACVVGAIIAAPCMWYLSTYGINAGAIGGMEMSGLTMPAIWMSYYSVETSSLPVFLLFFIVLAAVIYPALKAAWISPIEAMHHQ
ncbi:MAG: ABC transporter permease [Deltaproteobacteria bacterium]|nr:ABC transporter permease [Deltaproteobacteria bacterium]